VIVIVSALAVLVLAAWVLTPILLINYPTAFAARPLSRDIVADGATSDPRAPSPPATGPKSQESRIERPADPREPEDTTAAAEPAPAPDEEQKPPAPALAATSTRPFQPSNALVATVAPVSQIPWPIAKTPTDPPGDGEHVAASNTLPALFGRVPLPPRRPDAASLARLGTPLPRPRPTEAPPVEAEAMSDAERMLFDRHTGSN
jgi:hypothetical protein